MPVGPSQSTFLAVLHATAAELHLSRLDPRLSWEHAERSLALQRQRATDRRLPDRGLIATLLSAADAALDLNKLDSAQARLAEAEQLVTGDLGPGSTAYLAFLARRGRYRFLLATRRAQERDSDDLGLAIQDLEEAATGFRGHQIRVELPAILVHLAQAFLLAHRTQEALTAAEEAYAIDLDLYGPGDHPETRIDLEILALVKAVADGTRS
jgi:tetratricopeptide (TPR) repeat protein